MRINIILAALGLLLAMTMPLLAQQASPAASPFSNLLLDKYGNDVGVAQQTAHSRGLSARILWMDAGANVGNLNSDDKIRAIIAKVKASGLNMIVLDVKPIVGDVIYPSKYAPKLTEWKAQTVAADFDVLRHVLDAAHAAGLPVYANMSTFGEGHKSVGRGLAYTHPDWQTILYEVDRGVRNGRAAIPISVTDALPKDDGALGALTGLSLLKKDQPGYTVAVLDFIGRVIAVYDGSTLSKQAISIPPRGSALIGTGAAANWLAQEAKPGQILTYMNQPKYVPVVDAPEQKYTMFCDPSDEAARQHEWDIVREIVTNYDVDGVVFDDRLRYAGQNADFGPRSRAAFEKVVGHSLQWPDDIFRISPYPGQDVILGPYYQRWLVWRAGVITSWLDKAAQIVRSARPQAQVAVYAGSWYGDYEKVGSNWAGPDFTAPYHWLTPAYQATAYAGALDWLTTGCYYYPATIAEVAGTGGGPGATVEGAGQFSNLVVSDTAWTYAGIYAMSYQGHPDQFERAIAAAMASTQGVMIFDMSQIIQYDWWDVMAGALAGDTGQAPNLVPRLLAQVRGDHATERAQGVPPPPLPSYVGLEGTGF